MVNSSVSRQWFCERYAMNALKVHGGGAELERTSRSVGLLGQYGPTGMARLSGLEGKCSPDDIDLSSSASQSEKTVEQRGDGLVDVVSTRSERGFSRLDLLIALRRYFMKSRTDALLRLSFLACSSY